MTSYGGGRDGNPGGPGGKRRKISGSSGHSLPPKKKGCCHMAAAVGSIKQGKFRVALRHARMSARVIGRKVALPVAAVLAALGVAVSVGAAPAAAGQGPNGYLSFWDGCNGGSNPTSGYCGAAWALTAAGGIGVCHAMPNGSAGRPSAFDNETGHDFRVWTGTSACTGSSATLYSGTETGQLDAPYNNGIRWQQRIN